MRMFRDQMGRVVEVPLQPRRIVSLVPSQTELLYELGLESEVVGITRFCIHPDAWFHSKVRVGGTKDATLERIMALNPDLVIGNKEENAQHLIEELESKVAVWMSDVTNVEQALAMITDLGTLTAREEKAQTIRAGIENEIQGMPSFAPLRCVYVIWNNPVMVAARNTFIDDMLRLGGCVNCFGVPGENRYPETSWSEIRSRNPEVIFLSSEPYPFSQQHIAQIKREVPEAEVVLVDGEIFSWYGSRMMRYPAYIRALRDSL